MDTEFHITTKKNERKKKKGKKKSILLLVLPFNELSDGPSFSVYIT